MTYYNEYSPDYRLQRLIECYWSSHELMPNNKPQKIMPDGCIDIIISFGGKNTSYLQQQGLPFLIGTTTSFIEVRQTFGIIEMIGIRFKPSGITAFTRMPIHELTNQRLDLDLADTIFDKSFYEKLSELKTTFARIAHIENYLLQKLPYLYETDRRIIHAAELILDTKGQMPISKIMEKVYMSERQFERLFKPIIGLSPKTFSKIIRFRYTSQYIQLHADESIYSVAIHCGYHDDSHLAKDFKQLGGILPKETY